MECYHKCNELLEDDELTSKGIIPAISVCKELGLIYEQQDLYDVAKTFLIQAENLYIKFTKVELDPIVTPIIGIKEMQVDWCAKNILDKLHISILYSLAKICRNLVYKPACTREDTQSKELCEDNMTNKKIMKNYADWAVTVAKISFHFIEENQFSQARYHLAVTSYILRKYLKTLREKHATKTIENFTVEYEHYNEAAASIAKFWAKYGITLLCSSRKRLIEGLQLESELKIVSSKFTDKYLLDFNSAKVLFWNVKELLNNAKLHYTFEKHPSDYASITLLVSRAYDYLGSFECEDKRIKMHERRVEILEEVINSRLCPRDNQIICRRIWIDLAEAYLTMVNLMEMRLQVFQPRLHQNWLMSKIESRAKSSIKHYQSYLNSLEMSKSESGVESFSDDELYIALCAYNNLGALYNKIVTFDIHQEIEYMQNSLDAYTFIVNYYNNHPEKQKELEKYEFIKSSKETVTRFSSALENCKKIIDDAKEIHTKFANISFSDPS
ncbi:KIF1-binding protein like protein [Cyphomyrmex costatus]|uniref:KIF-binding protein n=1 Tax=Cyphomyrmex costatus TaxID=456900 RepID=A0A151IBX9_9HYME|nr:KIF1-binding protein like protein [Cyphomyrmex costatus]